MSRLARAVPRAERAWKCPRAWAMLIGVFTIGVSMDLLTKRLAFHGVAHAPVHLDRDDIVRYPRHDPVPVHEGVELLPGDVFELRLVVNRGAVFGLAENRVPLLISFTAVALAAGLIVFARGTRRTDHLAHVAVALVLAGGIGNLHDRISFGAVRDFIKLLPGRQLPFEWTWGHGNTDLLPWVFNLADVLLLAGMLLLVLYLNLAGSREMPLPDGEDAVAA